MIPIWQEIHDLYWRLGFRHVCERMDDIMAQRSAEDLLAELKVFEGGLK